MQGHADWVFGISWVTTCHIVTGLSPGAHGLHALRLAEANLSENSACFQPRHPDFRSHTAGACTACRVQAEALDCAGSRDKTVKLWQVTDESSTNSSPLQTCLEKVRHNTVTDCKAQHCCAGSCHQNLLMCSLHACTCPCNRICTCWALQPGCSLVHQCSLCE